MTLMQICPESICAESLSYICVFRAFTIFKSFGQTQQSNELAPVNVEARPYGEQLIGPTDPNPWERREPIGLKDAAFLHIWRRTPIPRGGVAIGSSDVGLFLERLAPDPRSRSRSRSRRRAN